MEDQVRDFLVARGLITKNNFSLETELGADLGVDGADAEELMEAFGAGFNVDMKDFEFDKHFGPEVAFNPVAYLYNVLFEEPLLPVTIGDLVETAKNGAWTYIKR